MLNQYLQRTQLLLTDMKQEMLNPAFLKMFVNTARGQLAGEAECIRVMGTVPTVIGQRSYNFSDIDVGVSATTGVQAPIHVRTVSYSVPGADGQLWIPPRPWAWFSLYEMNNVTPLSGAPETWAQFAQGAAPGASGSVGGGSFYISPLPDAAYTLNCNCVCYPIPLVDDTTVEAIPYLWTDAVPYFTAYLSYLYLQNNGAAKNMMEMYGTFVKRARMAATPATGGWQYEQSDDPAQLSKFAKPGAA